MGSCQSQKRRDAYKGGEEEAQTKAPAVRMIQGEHKDAVNCVGRMGDPDLILYGSEDCSVRCLNWRSGEVVESWHGHARGISKVVYARRRDRIVSCSRDLSIRMWKPKAESAVTVFSGHSMTVTSVDIDCEERVLWSGGRDNSVRVWDVETGNQQDQSVISRNLVTCLKAFPHDTNLAAQGSEDLSLRIWDRRQGLANPPATVFRGYVYFPLDIDVSESGHFVLTSSKGFNGSGCEARIWDMRGKSDPLLNTTEHEQDAVGCAFVEQDSRGVSLPGDFCTTSKDGALKFWSTELGKSTFSQSVSGIPTCLEVLNNPTPAAKGHVVCGTFDGSLKVFGLACGAGGDLLASEEALVEIEMEDDD